VQEEIQKIMKTGSGGGSAVKSADASSKHQNAAASTTGPIDMDIDEDGDWFFCVL